MLSPKPSRERPRARPAHPPRPLLPAPPGIAGPGCARAPHRIYGTQRALTQYGYSLWEFEVFGV